MKNVVTSSEVRVVVVPGNYDRCSTKVFRDWEILMYQVDYDLI
jgi:hypothetical protein